MMQVDAYGFVTFGRRQQLALAEELAQVGVQILAPFWADHDKRRTGEIYFRFSQEAKLLNDVGARIGTAFKYPFYPKSIFIATWDRVPRYGGNDSQVGVCTTLSEKCELIS